MITIRSYSCITSQGFGAEALWNALSKTPLQTSNGIFKITESKPYKSSLEKLTSRLLDCWSVIQNEIQPSELKGSLGVILASTKGCLEDIIWNSNTEILKRDPLSPVLESFIQRSELSPKDFLCVTNACASSHGAFYLAKAWMESGWVDHVLVLACDEVGPFIQKGFQSLGALSKSTAKPFAKNRDGLTLGEAASAVLFSVKLKGNFEIENTAIDTEGHSITRPSPSGTSLLRACRNVLKNDPQINAIIAHGTATKANDSVEDKVFSELGLQEIYTTGIKGTIGHTLGASGSMDLIAALEAMKRNVVFPISNTDEIDPEFKSNYVIKEAIHTEYLDRILITSLGFGGTHAALTLKRVGK